MNRSITVLQCFFHSNFISKYEYTTPCNHMQNGEPYMYNKHQHMFTIEISVKHANTKTPL
jgi:hypothetical protein